MHMDADVRWPLVRRGHDEDGGGDDAVVAVGAGTGAAPALKLPL